MPLEKYKQKRNFKETPEPVSSLSKKKSPLIFVVQRHDATRLHYDFRLEMEGVLKSWAVPKGPSLNPQDKRLAMMTEDHPYDYKDFEGEIPAGNYGAGIVEIWDSGTYEAIEEGKKNDEDLLLKGLEDGNLKFKLNGKKIKGEFALVKLKSGDDQSGKDNSWLLIKKKDEFAVEEPYDSEDFIAKDSKIKKGGNPKSKKGRNPKSKKGKAAARKSTLAGGDNSIEMPKDASKGSIPTKVKPMLAKLVDKPFNDPNYIFELKWDGYRAIAEVEKHNVNLYSRNGLSFNEKFHTIVETLQALEHDAVLDGEVVVLNEDGHSNFQMLQNYKEAYAPNLFFYVFDILFLDGYNLANLPLVQRKALIKDVVEGLPNIRYSDHIQENGEQFYEEARKNKLEGIIAKRGDSVYRAGKRSNDWLKIKIIQRQEFIICGFTEPKGGRKHIGSLVLGAYDNEGKLVYTGNAGGGFSDQGLKAAKEKLEPWIVKTSPFKNKIKTNSPVTWVKPELVCEVAFSEWTDEKVLRHPIFQGFREDKEAEEVFLDIPVPLEREIKKVKMESRKATTKKLPTKEEKKQVKKSKDSVAKKSSKSKNEVKIGGHPLILTNLEKIYFPDAGITKGDIINYYTSVGKFILPYLKDRPQSLHRHPNGIHKKGFFHKDMGDTLPDWIESRKIHSESNNKDINYLLCQNQATLTYMNNLGCIEINPWNSRIQSLDYPDYTVIDLDPADNTFEEVIETALVVKSILDKAGAECYCKTSGSSGMHIYIPLGAQYDYEQGKNFAHIIAQLVHAELPDITSIERSPKARPKSIYLDFLQNRMGQTLAAVYGVRPREGATVSTPLEWKEVKKGLHPSQFTITNMPQRLKKKGDLFKGVLGKGIDMEKCLDRLGG